MSNAQQAYLYAKHHCEDLRLRMEVAERTRRDAEYIYAAELVRNVGKGFRLTSFISPLSETLCYAVVRRISDHAVQRVSYNRDTGEMTLYFQHGYEIIDNWGRAPLEIYEHTLATGGFES